MHYRIERTFLTSADGRSDRQYDLAPYLIEAEDAVGAVAQFIREESATPMGGVTPLPGDKATGSALCGRRSFAVFAQRTSSGRPVVTIAADAQRLKAE